MTELLAQIDLIEKADSQYIAFARKIRAFAENCQQEKLEQSIKTLIDYSSN